MSTPPSPPAPLVYNLSSSSSRLDFDICVMCFSCPGFFSFF